MGLAGSTWWDYRRHGFFQKTFPIGFALSHRAAPARFDPKGGLTPRFVGQSGNNDILFADEVVLFFEKLFNVAHEPAPSLMGWTTDGQSSFGDCLIATFSSH
jgi:hypothetical protein